MTSEVMVDLETMGIGSDAAIVAIGAVKFDPRGTVGVLGDASDPNYKPFYATIPLASSLEAGLTVDGTTVEWWLRQDAKAREAVTMEPRVDLETALSAFWDWYGPESMPTWGNGADFDCVILRNAYQKFGGIAPFKFFHYRCFRTMKSLFPDVTYVKPTLAHFALADAEAQAIHLQKLFNFINQKG